jgi:hypothetical protein
MDEQRLQCCGFAASLNHYAPTVFHSPASPQFTAGVTEFTSNIGAVFAAVRIAATLLHRDHLPAPFERKLCAKEYRLFP